MRSVLDICRKMYYQADALRYVCSRVETKHHMASDSVGDFPHGIGVCAIVKNEGRYIEEWLRYHQIVGVDVVYLYNNDSTDDTVDCTRPFIESGFVSLTDFPGQGRQLDAYNDCLRRHRFDCKYIAFIDADEFIFKMDPSLDMLDVLDSIMSRDPNAGGVAINWRMFGSSGYDHRPAGGCLIAFSGALARR